MKFITAIGILIQSLQTTTSARSLLLTREEQIVDHDHRGHQHIGLYHRQGNPVGMERGVGKNSRQQQQKKDTFGASSSSSSSSSATSRGLLTNKNVTMKRHRDDVESDPKECSPDQGVLQCGLQEYCMESKQSTLGGYCTINPTTSTAKDHRLRRVLPVSSKTTYNVNNNSDRTDYDTSRPDYSYNWTAWKSYYNSYCKPRNYTYNYGPSRTCTCSNVDEEAYTLEASCQREQSCFNTSSRCGSEFLYCSGYQNVLKLKGKGAKTTTRCTENEAPYYQKLCYKFEVVDNVVESCSIEFNGETCNSCTVETQEAGTSCYYNEDNTKTCSPWYQTCYVFDCSNTAGKHTGSNCDWPNTANKLSRNMNYIDCVQCNICELAGETGLVSLPYEKIEIQRYGYLQEVECFQADFRGKSQELSTDDCAKVQEIALNACGCQVCNT
jgi:hypothetical protein